TFNAPSSVNEGTPIFLSLTSPHDPSNADTAAGFTYKFDCGLGAGFQPSPDNTASCPTDDNGSRTVKGRIFDKDGGYSEYTRSVHVNNVAPDVTAAADQSSDEGASKSFALGSFTDPGADSPWQVTVNWGDGSPATTFNSTPGPLGTRYHSYAD